MSCSLGPCGVQHARLPCPSLSPGVYSNSCPFNWRCHPTISSCVSHFSCPQSFPASKSFPMNWLFLSGGQSTEAEWIKKQDKTICCLQEIHFNFSGIYILKVKDGNLYTRLIETKKSRGSCIYIRQNGCESKSVTRDNESHSIVIKESVYQKDIAFVIIYVLKMWAPTYMEQILTDLQAEIDVYALIVGDLNYFTFNNG